MKLPSLSLIGILSSALLCAGLFTASSVLAELRVVVQGLDGELRDNVLALLTVQRERATEGLSDGHVRRYFERGPREIRLALEPFGYYGAQIDSELRRAGDDWIAEYRVQTGEPVRFTAADVRITGAGEADPELRKAIAGLDIHPGEPARHSRYESARARLQNLAFERGYLDATYTRRELRVDTAKLSAEAVLHLETGPQFQFGEITFTYAGLDESLVRRYLNFQPGDPYSNARLMELQRVLEDSGYFARIDVLPQRDQAGDHAVPIRVELEGRKRHKYTAGLGFGTDTGARGLLGWEHRRINRHGHRMNAEIRVSEIRQALIANYNLPLENPRSDRLDFSALVQDEATDSVDSGLYKLAAGRTVQRGSWRETLSLGYQREDFEVGLTRGITSLLIPGISYFQVRTDDRIFATRGHSLQFDLRGAAEPVLSDVGLVQAGVKAKLIRSLGDNGRIIARAEGGTTWVDAFDKLPPSLRYFAGGDQSVRGYDFQDLGPRDASGEVVGGRHLVFGSLEYEQRIHGNWGVAAFVDTGNAFNSADAGLETGAGLGLRWRSPIGMVRLDLAAAVSQDNALRLHFTLGPDL